LFPDGYLVPPHLTGFLTAADVPAWMVRLTNLGATVLLHSFLVVIGIGLPQTRGIHFLPHALTPIVLTMILAGTLNFVVNLLAPQAIVIIEETLAPLRFLG
jgi:hypothetical protein